MLAVFQKSMCEGPSELVSPKLTRSHSMTGRLDAMELFRCFRVANPSAFVLQFDEQHAVAYANGQERIMTRRQFASADDIFCAFAGNLENLPNLRHRYGLDRHVSEVNFIIEAYKVLRDRAPYTADQVLADLMGAFAFVLYDNRDKKIFVAADSRGKVPLYWGKCSDDGVLAFSDDAAVLKAGCGTSFAPFPLGCYYSSSEGLKSYQHPCKELKAFRHIDSEGELCGSTFKVPSNTDLPSLT